MSALWIDLWDKRCWIAIEIDGFSFPKDIVQRVKIIWVIKQYCQEYTIDTIVVGLPYDLYWVKTKQLIKTEKFIQKLHNIFPQHTIVGIDERFTTSGADIIMWEYGNKKKSKKRDDISAQFILESYIAQQKKI